MKHLECNKNINRGFRKLEVWQEAVELFKFVKEKIDHVNNISFKTKGQIEDSILSVSSNIAEGYCRKYIRENIQYNNIALGSLGENYTQIYALFNSGIIEEDWFNEYDAIHYSLENKLIRYNHSQIKILKSQSDWQDDYKVREIAEHYLRDEQR